MNEITIKVWRFEDAPEEYQELSPHGGDEDWIAFIPQKIWDEEYGMITWCEGSARFAPCRMSQHEVYGGIVRIGAHSFRNPIPNRLEHFWGIVRIGAHS